MSVINKMLRDLDQRQSASSGKSLGNSLTRDQLMCGTQALAVPAGSAPRRMWLIAALGVSLLLAGLVAWWVMSFRSGSAAGQTRVKQAPQAAVVLVSPPTEVPFALTPTPAAALASPVVTSAPTVVKIPAVNQAVKLVNPAAANAVGWQVAAQVSSTPVPSSKVSSVMPQPAVIPLIPAAAPVAGASTALSTVQAKDSVQRGGNQALAQAQAMWNEGARTSAIDLLRQALSRVEALSPGVASEALVALVRELARMELADGQVNNSLALLQRLEPQISAVADLWAMRGNAAQRLGQHAEAVSSYQRALALKSNEPRWLLGLAVSLAAQGQTTQAADLVEKVRVTGALRPEIASYLRQLGVVIRAE
jgi:predicted negative regulator of RcsB-dependent stress response